MFKRVLDCWSSKAPPLPLLQYVRVWNSHCGDMPVVQQQGLKNLWVYGSSHKTFSCMGYPILWYGTDNTCKYVQQQGHALPCSMFKRVFDSRSSHDSCRLWLTTLKYTCGTNCGTCMVQMWHMYGTKSVMYGSKCSICMVQWVLYYGTCKVQHVGSHVRSLQLSWAAVSLVFGLHPNSDPGCSAFRNEDDDCLMQSHEKVREEGRGIAELIRNNR